MENVFFDVEYDKIGYEYLGRPFFPFWQQKKRKIDPLSVGGGRPVFCQYVKSVPKNLRFDKKEA